MEKVILGDVGKRKKGAILGGKIWGRVGKRREGNL